MLTPIAQILGKSDQSRTYADKLRDPRWEQCRSQFVRRHGNKCSSCNRKGIEVQVHHKVYRRGVEPWDHPETDLILLCRGCHQDWHDLLQEFRSKVIGTIPVSVARVIIRALNLLLHFNRPASVGYALAQLACEEATVTHLSARYQAEDRKHQ